MPIYEEEFSKVFVVRMIAGVAKAFFARILIILVSGVCSRWTLFPKYHDTFTFFYHFRCMLTYDRRLCPNRENDGSNQCQFMTPIKSTVPSYEGIKFRLCHNGFSPNFLTMVLEDKLAIYNDSQVFHLLLPWYAMSVHNDVLF